jgi:DNA-binding beta-propeller fold protein YncE
MASRFGQGGFTYEVVEGWARIPVDWDLVEIPAIAVDSQDRLYCLTRSDHPIVVFDRDGRFIGSWGEGNFVRPHGIFIGSDDTVYCVDDQGNSVRRFTPDGRLLATIGPTGKPSETGFIPNDFLSVKKGGAPYNLPTNIALAPDGCIYVTDGYGNCRVHKFSPDGELLLSWGKPGSGPGEFYLVHGICVDREGVVYVGDRMNSRIQLFSPNGEFIDEWDDVYQPNDIYLDREDHLFVAEIGYRADLPKPGPEPAPDDSYSRVTVRNRKGEILAKITSPNPREAGGFLSAHGVRVDSQGDLYVSEVSATRAKIEGYDRREFNVLQKFLRVGT